MEQRSFIFTTTEQNKVFQPFKIIFPQTKITSNSYTSISWCQEYNKNWVSIMMLWIISQRSYQLILFNIHISIISRVTFKCIISISRKLSFLFKKLIIYFRIFLDLMVSASVCTISVSHTKNKEIFRKLSNIIKKVISVFTLFKLLMLLVMLLTADFKKATKLNIYSWHKSTTQKLYKKTTTILFSSSTWECLS